MPARSIPPDRLVDGHVRTTGLSSDKVNRRLKLFGFNDILVAPPSTWLDLAKDTLRDPMIWFLVVVSTLFFSLGEIKEALVLIAAIVPLVGMDAYMHRRTQASTQGLASRLASTANVIRNGTPAVLPAREIVPGDIVEVKAGEAIPADGILIDGLGLQLDESSLTGEAYPVRKTSLTDTQITNSQSVDTEHWAFAGTRLLTGTARLQIVSTGGETLYGEIVRSATSTNRALTPLQQAVGRLVTAMLIGALLLCGLLAVIRILQGHGLVDAFLSAVTLAVAALPEEFPVVLTFYLGVGVYRLARRQALVRRAVAVENIGRVTCICSDKTGTLTEGKLILAHDIPASYISPHELITLASMACRSESSDPLDLAILNATRARPEFNLLASFPFTEDRSRETAIVRLNEGEKLAVVKGAPETVIAMCTQNAETTSIWRERVASYAAGGHKVIAVASKPFTTQEDGEREPNDGFIFTGILALEDPVREGVRDAVAACKASGIRIIMVTGDHPATAAAIAREIGLNDGNPVVELADILDTERSGPLSSRLKSIDAIARAKPSQKLHLVQALKEEGEIVAVTGDGVNDVPALQMADIGIAMGERGTQSAREVASIVLLNDNFKTIVQAIAEGRQLCQNLQMSIVYLLLIHIPFVLSAAAIPLANNPLAFLPIHIVWLELIIHPTALLVFQDLPSSNRLAPVERVTAIRFFSTTSWTTIIVSGLILTALISIGFEIAVGPEGNVVHARSIAMSSLVCISAAVTIVLSKLATQTARVIVAVELATLILFVQIPVLSNLVQLTPLHLSDWAIVVGTGILAAALTMIFTATMRRSARVQRASTIGTLGSSS